MLMMIAKLCYPFVVCNCTETTNAADLRPNLHIYKLTPAK